MPNAGRIQNPPHHLLERRCLAFPLTCSLPLRVSWHGLWHFHSPTMKLVLPNIRMFLLPVLPEEELPLHGERRSKNSSLFHRLQLLRSALLSCKPGTVCSQIDQLRPKRTPRAAGLPIPGPYPVLLQCSSQHRKTAIPSSDWHLERLLSRLVGPGLLGRNLATGGMLLLQSPLSRLALRGW